MTSTYRVEPLGEQHSRAGFKSGVGELDRYFEAQAGQDAKRKVAAPFVLVDLHGVVAGYYTLSAYAVRLADLSFEATKKLPKYPLLPATLLGRLAVRHEQQGKKLGQFLLMDALRRSLQNTSEIGSIGVLVDAYDATADRFYLHHEFVALLGQNGKLFLAMATIKRLF